MTFSAVPFALQNVPINADIVRQAVSSMVPNGGGVIQAGDLAVTQTGTPSMGIQIGVGRAWIPGNVIANVSGQTYSKQAMYFVLNDASLTATLANSDGTNPRIDTIYVAIEDAIYAGSNNDVMPTYVVTGAPNATPVAIAAPANSITLATVYVGAGVPNVTNANITPSGTLAVVAPVAANLSQPITRQPVIKAATIAAITTNANGDGSITFATPFPNALTAASLQDASAPANLGPMFIKWTSASSDKTKITFRVYGANGVALANLVAGNGLALGYIATGY